MRDRIAATCIALVLVAQTVSTMAAEASAQRADQARTVSVPEVGVAVTFPPGWRIESSHALGHPGLIANYLFALGTCELGLLDMGATLAAAADAHLESFHPTIEVLEVATLELPIGQAVHVAWTNPATAPTSHSWYHFPVGEEVAMLRCTGQPPQDRWLGIASSLELLGGQGGPPARADADFTGRVELPPHGFAMDFPAAWQVIGDGADTPLDQKNVLAAWRSDGADDSWCTVDEYSWLGEMEAWTGAGGMADWLLSDLAWWGSLEDTPSWEATRTDLELAAGPAVRVDAVADDGYAFTSYSISDGTHWWELRCSASTPPGDRWLSIAETFEFLPEER